jgi:hypothetical protein
VWDGIEVGFQVYVDSESKALLQKTVDTPKRVFASSIRPKTVTVFGKLPFQYRFDHMA